MTDYEKYCKLSIIIPVYNEEETLGKVIDAVQSIELPLKKEIIVIDDASTDGTRQVIEQLPDTDFVKVSHKKNQGKGAALRSGFAKATGDIILVQDADLEYDPAEYPKLLKPILDGKADVVYGSRFVGSGAHRVLYFWHMVGNRFLTLVSNTCSNLNLTDMETCYKVFTKEVIDKIDLEENRFGIEPEITAKIARLVQDQELAVYEVGISYFGRTYSEGKKIGLKDAFRAAWCIWKYNTTTAAKIIKYVTHGAIIALTQFVFMVLLVQGAQLTTAYELNLANILSIEGALLVAFFLHSSLTWHVRFTSVREIVKSLIEFHLVTSVSILTRIASFYFLNFLGFHYILNVSIGIIAAILINYFGYEKIVFNKDRAKQEPFMEPILRKMRIRRVLHEIGKKPECALLDVGCGFNHAFLSAIEPYIGSGTGIDFKVSEKTSDKMRTLQVRLDKELPFESGSFDTATMLAVLEHLDHPLEIIQEIARVLKPGGKLILTVPGKRAKPVLEFLSFKLGIVNRAEIEDHKKYYDLEELKNLIQQVDSLDIVQHRHFQLGMNNFCVIQKK
ncbi:MAG: glycosyltransferase [Candidatus Electrothrix sp. ATG2]|nr:glycosyltransferase [Candidatus Electrothrix sp. ATG2]